MGEWFFARFATEDDLRENLSRLGNSTRWISRGSLLLYDPPWGCIRKMPILAPLPLEHYIVSTPLDLCTLRFRGRRIKKGNLSTNELIDNMMFLRPQMAWDYGRLKWFSTAHDTASGVEFEYFGPRTDWEGVAEITKLKSVQGYARGMAKWLVFMEKVYAENWTPFMDKQEGDEHLLTHKR